MTAALIAIAGLMALLLARVPLGLSMVAVGFTGIGFIRGWNAAVNVVGFEILAIATNFSFVVLPLFILMGVFVARAALSDDLYDMSNAWLGHFPGGLAIATVAACGGFAAISGSSAATAATMAKVAIPSMRRYGYSDSFAAGTVAAGGTMGILIPPSAAMIIYGILTESDIGALFIGGILPGILTIALYVAVVMVVVRVRPAAGPRGERMDWAYRWLTLTRVWGVLALFFLILGGIFFGIFTPSEAGGIGAIGALAFAIGRRKINWTQFYRSLAEAGHVTGQIFTVAFGALILNQFVNVAKFPEAMLAFIDGLDITPLAVIFVILGIFVVLGMFIEGIAMILLTAPIFVPIVEGLGFSVIWFGIVMIMAVEISLITPPIGLNVFILKSMMPEVPLGSIFRGIGPFFVADLIRLAIVVFFPPIVLFLPALMK
ncbi:MAG: TRAP transporter large permease [Proteobacteria bacterium]|nr:TRAP transporter large permease [Pseudomonadota bacterium]